MKTIELTQGQVALVDDEDFEWLSQWKWRACRARGGGFYAMRTSARICGKRKTIYMHREISPAGEQTDHINLKKLDNQKVNLRPATSENNMANRGKSSNNTSGWKGVSWHKRERNWQAQIALNNKDYYLGSYDSAEEAARAYDVAARNLQKDFAWTNFP